MLRAAKNLIKAVTGSETVDVSELDGVRALHLGSSTVQSAMRIRDPFALELAYTRGVMCFLLFSQHIEKVLTIGLGGGSLAKYMHLNCPEITAKVIELNPRIIQVARNQFYLPDNDERLEVIEGDGLLYLAEYSQADSVNKTDFLIIDAFDSNGIPPNFCSQDFFDQCANVLKSDGIFAINLWGSDKKFDVYLQRIEQSFEGLVLTLPTGRPGNIIVFGFKREPADLRLTSLRDRAKVLEQTHKIEFLKFVEKFSESNPSSSNRLFMTKNIINSDF